MISFNILLL